MSCQGVVMVLLEYAESEVINVGDINEGVMAE
jgi:hypothetical protein